MDSTQQNKVTPTAAEKAELIVGFADEIKAEQIETLDVRQKTSITEFMIICTGTSDTHVNSIVGRVEEKMAGLGIKPLRTAPGVGSGWVLIDFGEVLFHCMREERRQFYDLESLWTSMQTNPDLP